MQKFENLLLVHFSSPVPIYINTLANSNSAASLVSEHQINFNVELNFELNKLCSEVLIAKQNSFFL